MGDLTRVNLQTQQTTRVLIIIIFFYLPLNYTGIIHI